MARSVTSGCRRRRGSLAGRPGTGSSASQSASYAVRSIPIVPAARKWCSSSASRSPFSAIAAQTTSALAVAPIPAAMTAALVQVVRVDRASQFTHCLLEQGVRIVLSRLPVRSLHTHLAFLPNAGRLPGACPVLTLCGAPEDFPPPGMYRRISSIQPRHATAK